MRRGYPTIAFAVGCALCAWVMGVDILVPTSVGWIMSSDLDIPQHFTGWSMFRYEPWTWPPGLITRIWEPAGTSIGMTDSIPLLAFPFKLASPFLPRDFQYFGFWIFLNYGLMAVFTYIFMGRFTTSVVARFLAIPVVVINTAFIMRDGHPALQAHWVFLASLSVYFSSSGTPRRRIVLALALISAVSGLIHPYLAVMNAAIVVACLLRPRDLPMWRLRAVFEIALTLAPVFVCWYLTGYFALGESGLAADEWGPHGFNLVSFINPDPAGTSRFFPEFPLYYGSQWQGRSFLGAGGLLVVGAALLLGVRAVVQGRRMVPFHLVPLLTVLACLTLFATGGTVTFSDTELFQWGLPAVFDVVTSTFAKSGRFIWPVFYAVLGLACAAVVRLLPRRVAVAVLTLAAILQAVDSRPVAQRRTIETPDYQPVLSDQRWPRLLAEHPKVTWVPGYGTSMRSIRDFRHFLHVLAPDGGSLNAGYLARTDPDRDRRLRDEIMSSVREGRLEPDRLYVVNDQGNIEIFRASFEQATMYALDGYVAFHAGQAPRGVRSDRLRLVDVELADYLERWDDHLVVLSVENDAADGLTDETRARLERMGAQHLPGSGEPYVAVLSGGEFVHEAPATEGQARASWRTGQAVGGIILQIDLTVSSRAPGSGPPRSSIVVGAEEVSLKRRGFNVCVLDRNSEIVDVVSFDTHVATRTHRLVAAP